MNDKTAGRTVYLFEGTRYVALSEMAVAYIARDANHRVFGYTSSCEPTTKNGEWSIKDIYTGCDASLMIPVDRLGIDWKDSLVKAVIVDTNKKK